MFPDCPADKFLPHRWREDTVELGRLEAEWVEAAFEKGDCHPKSDSHLFRTDWPVQVNRILRDPQAGKAFSLIISIGQVVPHEIAGMANHTKNIFIGTGGAEAINKSHYLGALYGLERLMGETENPVRALFDEAFARYGRLLPPVLWVLSVVDGAGGVRGLFTGFGREPFEKAAALSREVNITYLDEPARKIVVRLDAAEYRSLWLGNKAVYRTRKAIARGGELVILGPGLDCFGEDPENDALIRRYGYRGTEAVRRAVESASRPGSPGTQPGGLSASLSAAAHLIHGSSEGRFTIRYCPGPGLSREDIEGAGYQWGDLAEASARYLSGPAGSSSGESGGWKTTADGERYYYVDNPGLLLLDLKR
jgi:nickel-dependent lactate racemase